MVRHSMATLSEMGAKREVDPHHEHGPLPPYYKAVLPDGREFRYDPNTRAGIGGEFLAYYEITDWTSIAKAKWRKRHDG